MGRETREKIMLTAIKLFNEEGVTNVSTVKLSNELHISPEFWMRDGVAEVVDIIPYGYLDAKPQE